MVRCGNHVAAAAYWNYQRGAAADAAAATAAVFTADEISGLDSTTREIHPCQHNGAGVVWPPPNKHLQPRHVVQSLRSPANILQNNRHDFHATCFDPASVASGAFSSPEAQAVSRTTPLYCNIPDLFTGQRSST